MSQTSFGGESFLVLHILIQIALIVRVLLRPHRDPASRIAWIVVIHRCRPNSPSTVH